MTPDIAKLADSLTEAQRGEIMSLSGEWKRRGWSGQQPPWSVWLPPSILEQGSPVSLKTQRLRLTPLGLALRAHLQKEAGR